MNRVALLDLDGTLADFDGKMASDLEKLRGPTEPPYEPSPGENHPEHIENRMSVIKKTPGWWRKLPKYEPGFQIVELLREFGFTLHILTKGPHRTTAAWTEKVDWVQEHLPDAGISVVTDKGLTYGQVLVDDWPEYTDRWLEWRPRGLVIMPVHPWNASYSHPNVVKFDGTSESLQEVRHRLEMRLGVKGLESD